MRNVVSCSQPPSNIVAKTHPCIEFIEEAEPGGQLEFQPGVEVGRVGLAGRKSGEELFDGFQGQHVVDRVSAGSVKGFNSVVQRPDTCGEPERKRRFEGEGRIEQDDSRRNCHVHEPGLDRLPKGW